MKIIFFCASLEPGRDGVGDYTVQLAGECARLGHACSVIALHDPFVAGEERVIAGDVRQVRLSSRHSWRARVDRVAALVALHPPQWISWQMVAYGYHARGLLPGALSTLARGLNGPRHHVMLHELWLGLEKGAPWRERLLGRWQAGRLLRWLRELQPRVLHTSNPTYQHILEEAGFAARVLPLFGNVPIARKKLHENLYGRWLPDELAQTRDLLLVALTFGTVHPQWHPAATANWLRQAAQALGRRPVVLAVGRLGRHGDALEAFERIGVAVAATGEQDLPTISGLLGEADFGIALHPWALVGKSGAAAAMLDHGLPVLVPRDDWQRNGAAATATSVDPLLRRLDTLPPTETARWLALRRHPEPALPRVARLLLDSLLNAPAAG